MRRVLRRLALLEALCCEEELRLRVAALSAVSRPPELEHLASYPRTPPPPPSPSGA